MRLQLRAVEGYHGSLWEIFPFIELLLAYLYKAKKKYATESILIEFTDLNENITENRKYIRTSIDNCIGKLDEYYKKIDLTPVYAAALILHSGKKWRYFEMK